MILIYTGTYITKVRPHSAVAVLEMGTCRWSVVDTVIETATRRRYFRAEPSHLVLKFIYLMKRHIFKRNTVVEELALCMLKLSSSAR